MAVAVVNLNRWTLPSKYAKFKGVSNQVVHNWIIRRKVNTKFIPELELILVEIPKAERADWRIHWEALEK